MNIILFGATGMVGQGVLRQCLAAPDVDRVLAIGRTPTGVTHAKLLERGCPDMFACDVPDADLQGYDACLFCLGVSSVGMDEDKYTRLTYDLTMLWANKLARVNPTMVFEYVSGTGTGGKAMWARVKGRTEQALAALFPSAYGIRLGVLWPVHGERPKAPMVRVAYIALWPLLFVTRALKPDFVITTEELGKGMLQIARTRPTNRAPENRDLRALAHGDLK